MSLSILTIAFIGGLCGFAGLVISLICLACVIGFTRSTHKIQYVPLETTELDASLEDDEDALELAELKKVGRKKLISEADEELEDIVKTDNF